MLQTLEFQVDSDGRLFQPAFIAQEAAYFGRRPTRQPRPVLVDMGEIEWAYTPTRGTLEQLAAGKLDVDTPADETSGETVVYSLPEIFTPRSNVLREREAELERARRAAARERELRDAAARRRRLEEERLRQRAALLPGILSPRKMELDTSGLFYVGDPKYTVALARQAYLKEIKPTVNIDQVLDAVNALIRATPRRGEQLTERSISDFRIALANYNGFDWSAVRRLYDDEMNRIRKGKDEEEEAATTEEEGAGDSGLMQEVTGVPLNQDDLADVGGYILYGQNFDFILGRLGDALGEAGKVGTRAAERDGTTIEEYMSNIRELRGRTPEGDMWKNAQARTDYLQEVATLKERKFFRDVRDMLRKYNLLDE